MSTARTPVSASALTPLSIVSATFAPRRTDDLRPEARAAIGWRGYWQASWLIEDGPYDGEWAMTPRSEAFLGFAWAPHGDLANVADAEFAGVAREG